VCEDFATMTRRKSSQKAKILPPHEKVEGYEEG
jgi:hypothetical protein